jgi:hypothetical protein
MIHKNEFTTIGVGFFEGRELTGFGAKWLVGCDCGGCREKNQE